MSIQDVLNSFESSGVSMTLRSGLRGTLARELSSRFGVGFHQVGDLLQLSNGCQLGGLVIMSAEEVFAYDDDIVAFQNWGNGDYDCVNIGREASGSVWFTNHTPVVRVRIAESVIAWLQSVREELERHESVWHPRDYLNHKNEDGVYATVVRQLAGTQCELMKGVS